MFRNTCARVNFFLPGQMYFVRTVFFVQSFFFLVESVTEFSGRQFLKKEHFLNNVADFLASGNHFFPIFFRRQSTAISGSNLFFNWSIFFSQSFISASEVKIFVYWKQHCFIVRFFLLAETMIEMRAKSIFKRNHWTPIFSEIS